jgi:hypothetical protein
LIDVETADTAVQRMSQDQDKIRLLHCRLDAVGSADSELWNRIGPRGGPSRRLLLATLETEQTRLHYDIKTAWVCQERTADAAI